MALPLLEIKPTTQNARVNNFMPQGSDAGSRALRTGERKDQAELDGLIEQAYQQIFFHAFKTDRDPALESQLRSGSITMRDFIRGLLLSDKFRLDFYRCNNNYRMVEQIVGRVLGRPVHGEQERIAWSILIAEQGLPALINTLLDSSEYLESFGDDCVPYQRSRVLAGQAIGSLPFNQQAPRYDAYWRDISARRAPAGGLGSGAQFNGLPTAASWVQGQPPVWAQRLWYGLILVGSLEVGRILLTTVAAMLSTGGQG